jgi:hypothetical protein
MSFLRNLIATGLLLTLANVSFAQPPVVPQSPPAVSPWINLTRPGGSPVQNYYGQVRPQFQAYNAFQNQAQFDAYTQMAINEQQQINQQLAQGPLPLTTGHTATYMNYGHYYPRLTNPTGSRMGVGTPQMPMGRRN